MAEDFPSQAFRDRIIQRLEPEIIKNQQVDPNSSLGTAKQVEESIFQKCQTKDEYLKSISRVIAGIKAKVVASELDSFLAAEDGVAESNE